MDNTQNIISFCTGYGGIELGIKRTGLPVRTVAYVEIEAFACANLVAKIEQGKMDAAPIWTNLKTFDGRPFRDKVHGIIGGYPCQPFSVAGKQQGDKDPRHLWPFIKTHIESIRPIWCFFENVAGHLRLGFDRVVRDLDEMGYDVQAGLFTAAEVGSPHKRERLFIMAHASGVRSDTGTERTGRETGSNFSGISEGTELGYAEMFGLEGQRPQGREQMEFDRASKKLDDTQHDGSFTRKGPGSTDETICEPEKRQNVTGDAAGASKSEELAFASSERIQRYGAQREQEPDIQTKKGLSGCDCRGNRWPARPGQPQHDWEEPRTVESGMGRTVDGFASRVDELRLLGNGVVPQTAELAFRTLWNKI